jgi:hypothetical protein
MTENNKTANADGKVPQGNYDYASMVSTVNAQQTNNAGATIKLQAQENGGKAFSLSGITTKEVSSQYGVSLMVNGTLVGTNSDLTVNEPATIFLNGKRLATFNEATENMTENDVVHFVCGDIVDLKDGKKYVPLEVLVQGGEA